MFKTADPTRVEVHGHAVLVRPLTAGELAAVYHLERTNKDQPWKSSFAMLAMSVLDTQGQKMFATAEDAEQVPQDVAAELMQHVKAVNGLDEHDAKKA